MVVRLYQYVIRKQIDKVVLKRDRRLPEHSVLTGMLIVSVTVQRENAIEMKQAF